uniref:ATP phosphoribosyltransferase n=1 Tax=Compsopogon caeruleus TaxID=31354 RepID=A0A7S1TD67_9RHOD|mmetsp:Transcript_14813/g.30146  ORF Transcript_14813/g.30146 Transcript_14813/m.30146 type:complete len:249 (+) Transcript_14813:1565-2311(+)
MSWNNVSSIQELAAEVAQMVDRPLRVATKFHTVATKFLGDYGISNYALVNMEGALEASTQMGTADCIIDLISSGTTLRENLLKEIEGGTILESTMQLIGNRSALRHDSSDGAFLRGVTQELLERIEAHTLGRDRYNLIANIRGTSPGEVARRLGVSTSLRGVDGPTISAVIPPRGENSGMYAIGIIVPKSDLYHAVQELRQIGGSGVCVLPVTFVFERSSLRWDRLMASLGQEGSDHHRDPQEETLTI